MADPMKLLKADHRDAKQLLAKLADSEEGAERQQMVEELTTKLTLHMELEEQIVYPPVAEKVGPDDAEEAETEHGLARDGLEKMNALVDAPGFGAAVAMVQAGIEHHVEEEETELLPELKDALSREEWQAMGDAIVEAKEAAGMPVPEPPKRRSTKRKKTTASSNRK